MPSVIASRLVITGLSVLALPVLPATMAARDAKTGTVAVPETEKEKQEREDRKMCAVALCATLYNRKPAKGHVTCSVRKTWRKEVIAKNLARAKVSWPWGDAGCGADLKFDRAILAKVMQAPELDVQFDTYKLRCRIEGADKTYDVTARIRPKVTFKRGKATKASLNWSKIEGPALARTALWPVAVADNTFGLLQSVTVEEINKYIGKKCMEVKEEWQDKQVGSGRRP